MKRNLLFLSLILCFGCTAFAQTEAIGKANKTYTQANYTLAVKQYEAVLASEGIAPELYYNLGNAYFKANEIGLSILNYERALRLAPNFEDARFNLELVQLKVIDNVTSTPTFFFVRWINDLINMLSSNAWMFTSIAVFLVCLLAVFIFIFGPTRKVRKNSFYVAAVFLAISALTLSFAGTRKDHLLHHREAIVMTGVIAVKSSPDKSGTDLFQLHEGTKVSIKSNLGNWTEIVLGNGGIGWVEQSAIEKI